MSHLVSSQNSSPNNTTTTMPSNFNIDHTFFFNVSIYLFSLLQTFFLSSFSNFGTRVRLHSKNPDPKRPEPRRSNNNNNDNDNDGEYEEEEYMSGEDVGMVMQRLGLSYNPESEIEKINEIFEEEPSLEELNEAFDVFDKKKDGFIDAEELQNVLCGLGFNEGFDLSSCRNMISKFDVNGDGKIDLSEFFRFMENIS